MLLPLSVARSLDPDSLLARYARGVFPMTDFDGVTRWYTASPRGVIPLDRFHVPATLRQTVRQNRFDVRINHDFRATMVACGSVPRRDREGDFDVGSWISDELIEAYQRLHELGFAHSVEAWQNGRLAGGLYGVTLGGAFFGESMFHRARDASKVALAALVQRLNEREFVLLDTQAVTPHLARFGAVEIPLEEYLQRLHGAIQLKRAFVDE